MNNVDKKSFVKPSNVVEYALGELVLVSFSAKGSEPIKAWTDSHIKTLFGKEAWALIEVNKYPF